MDRLLMRLKLTRAAAIMITLNIVVVGFYLLYPPHDLRLVLLLLGVEVVVLIVSANRAVWDLLQEWGVYSEELVTENNSIVNEYRGFVGQLKSEVLESLQHEQIMCRLLLDLGEESIALAFEALAGDAQARAKLGALLAHLVDEEKASETIREQEVPWIEQRVGGLARLEAIQERFNLYDGQPADFLDGYSIRDSEQKRGAYFYTDERVRIVHEALKRGATRSQAYKEVDPPMDKRTYEFHCRRVTGEEPIGGRAG